MRRSVLAVSKISLNFDITHGYFTRVNGNDYLIWEFSPFIAYTTGIRDWVRYEYSPLELLLLRCVHFEEEHGGDAAQARPRLADPARRIARETFSDLRENENTGRGHAFSASDGGRKAVTVCVTTVSYGGAAFTYVSPPR